MARGNDLNGYLCGGVRLDHESYTHEEVVEKMRKGMHMLIRESSVTHFLEENMKAVTEVNPAFARRVSFCTDDVTASDVLEKGHLDNRCASCDESRGRAYDGHPDGNHQQCGSIPH